MPFSVSWHMLLDELDDLSEGAELITPLSHDRFHIADVQEQRVVITFDDSGERQPLYSHGQNIWYMPRDEDNSESSDDEPSSSLSDLAARIDADDTSDPAAETEGSLSDLAESITGRTGATPQSETDDEPSDWDLVAGEDGDRSGFDAETEALLELVADATNLLLVGPADHPVGETLCGRLLSSRSDGAVNVLVVTVTDTPGQRLSTLENYLEGDVVETTVIDVQNYNREVGYGQYNGPVDIRRVSSAQDLRRIGIMISKILTEWDDAPQKPTMCFHSISDLLDLTDDPQRVFRFLHVLRGRAQSAGMRAHFHFDPERHEEQVARTFTSLFDNAIKYDDDGSVSTL